MNSPIQSIESLVRRELEGLCIAHDFDHIDRVRNASLRILKNERRGNALIVEAGALLHEFLDEKFFSDSDLIQRKTELREFLNSVGFSEDDREKVCFIVENVGYGKSLSRKSDFPYTLEMQIVEDADRLESIGAIAIARTFSFGGKHGRALYNNEAMDFAAEVTRESYRSANKSSSLAHFYEKLLLLKDMLHTQSARRTAEKRHAFMEAFLVQFYQEWNLEDMEF